MGGSQSTKTSIKEKISSHISTKLKNITENLSTTINSSITDISTTMVNDTKASIKQATTASNKIDIINDLTATGDGTIDLSQTADVNAENEAIIKIISDASSLATLAAQTSNDVSNKIQNNAQLKNDMNTAAKIAESSKNAGGPEAMLDKLADMAAGMVSSMTGGSSNNSTDMEKDITTKIENEIENTTINSNTVSNSVTNKINNEIKNITSASCEFNTNASNDLSARNVSASGHGTIKVAQKVSVKAFNKCLINLDIGGKIIGDLMQNQKFTSGTSSDNTSKSETAATTKSETEKTKQQESAFMGSVDNLVGTAGSIANSAIDLSGSFIYVIGIIIFICVIGVIYLVGSGAIDANKIIDRIGGSVNNHIINFLKYY